MGEDFRCFAAWVKGCHCSTGLGSVSLGQPCRCDRHGQLIVESKQISRNFWRFQVYIRMRSNRFRSMLCQGVFVEIPSLP